jgi:hypothetical protein
MLLRIDRVFLKQVLSHSRFQEGPQRLIGTGMIRREEVFEQKVWTPD